MPYPRSEIPETGCTLLANDYSISSRCRSNICLKLLVAARRQREMMVIIANAENVKSAEWQDEDNPEISEMIIPEKCCTGSRMSVYTITEHFFLSMGKCMKLSKHLGGGKLCLKSYYFRFQQIRIAGTSGGVQLAQSGS